MTGRIILRQSVNLQRVSGAKRGGRGNPSTDNPFSAVADKDYSHMIELLCKESKADAYVIAKVDNKRGAQADTLAALFRKYTDRPVYREDTLADAFTRALNEKGDEGKLYCLGSLYLVGELKELIGGEDA